MEYILKRPFYTKYAWLYDKIIERPFKSDCDFLEDILGEHSITYPITILDVGCGTGNYAIELAKRGYKVTGLDISNEQIAVAQSKYASVHENLLLEFIQADMFNLQLNKTFNLVLCRGVLNDIINDTLRRKIFRIFKSLLKDDGVLVSDVRDWDNTYKAKSISPITEKTHSLENGQIHFKSATKFNKKLKQLLITETHTLKSDHTEDIDEYDFIMQCWTIDELKNNLENAQFEKFNFYGDYNFNVICGETDKIIIVAS